MNWMNYSAEYQLFRRSLPYITKNHYIILKLKIKNPSNRALNKFSIPPSVKRCLISQVIFTLRSGFLCFFCSSPKKEIWMSTATAKFCSTNKDSTDSDEFYLWIDMSKWEKHFHFSSFSLLFKDMCNITRLSKENSIRFSGGFSIRRRYPV